MIIACYMVVCMVNAAFNSATSRETSHCFYAFDAYERFKANTAGIER